MACVGVPGGGGGVSGLDLCKRGEPLKWTDNGHFLRQLYGDTFLTNEARCNFARPTRREPRKEGRDSADKIYAIVASGVGPVGDHDFHGATIGARSRFTSALSVAAPISSERTGRNQ